MRRTLAASLACLALCAAAAARADEAAKVLTTRQANEENLAGAVAAPLRDVNVLRTKVPEALLDAMADPYPRLAAPGCAEIAEMIRPLDEALGSDLDAPAPGQEKLMVRGNRTAMGALAGFTSDVIPFRAWVRKLTGAEQHDRFVQTAILSGAVRRAYLKGLGESRSCAGPATPLRQAANDPDQPAAADTGYRGR